MKTFTTDWAYRAAERQEQTQAVRPCAGGEMNHRYKADFSEALDLKVSELDEPEESGEFEDDMEDFDPFNEYEREGLDELNFEDKR